MQRYVRQLIYDIEQRLEAIPTNIRYKNLNTKETIEEALMKATFKPLEERIHCSKDLFPPVNQLIENEIELILAALIRLLHGHGLFVNFPKDTPPNLKYNALIDHLEEQTPFLENHLWQLPLCGYEVKKCPFGTIHCQCKDWEEILFGFSDEIDDAPVNLKKGLTFINQII